MAIVSFSISSEANKIVRDYAKKLKVTKSKVVELALESYQKQQENLVTITLPRDEWKRIKKLG